MSDRPARRPRSGAPARRRSADAAAGGSGRAPAPSPNGRARGAAPDRSPTPAPAASSPRPRAEAGRRGPTASAAAPRRRSTPARRPGPSAPSPARGAGPTPSGRPAGRDRSAGGLLGGLLGAVAQRALAAVPRADLDERDTDYIRERLAGAWLLATLWFRGEVRGLDNIPASGPVLMVGNHSGGNLTPDTGVLTVAFYTHFGVERRFYQLAHNLVVSLPGLSWLRRFGTIAASHENARRALRSGAAVLVYPGGDHEVARPTWESARVDFGGRKGFLTLAIEERVPVVPVVSIGGQETALFLSRGEGLARLLRLDRMFRLKTLPLSLSLPWGLNIGDFFGHLPLPAKITVECLPPIDLVERFGAHPDIDEVYDAVIGEMQRALDRLAAERRFPLLG